MTHRHGYYTGSGYTYGAYSEPSPERLALLCLLHAHRPPDLASPFRVLELGCGQGFHLCLQAANYPQASFLGVDFNPDHIAHARTLAAMAGLENVRFLQADFLELERQPTTLEESFDMVVAHGILGWVSPSVGSALLRLSAAVLRPGGLLYLSYNTLPGWLAALPLQHTIRSLEQWHGHATTALEEARNLFASLRDSKAKVFEAQPTLAPRLEGIATSDPAYLLHEYNHSEWQPLYSNQVIWQAKGLGLSYLGSANLPENFDGLLADSFRSQLQQQQDSGMKELVRDLLTNQSFRRDVYVKGRDPLWPREAVASLEALRFLRLADEDLLAREDVFQFRLSFGEVQGNPSWFRGIMHALPEEPFSLASLHNDASTTPLPELLQNLMLLISKDLLVPVPPDRNPEPARRFNGVVGERVAAGAPYRSLACPRSGNLCSFSDLDLLTFHALMQGRAEAELVEALDASLQALDRKPMYNGQPLEASERRDVLQTLVEVFLRRTLPRMRRLGVVA